MSEKPSIETRITFWDWRESYRPELRLLSDSDAVLEVGGREACEISGEDMEELICLMEGYRDIFQAAIEQLNQEKSK